MKTEIGIKQQHLNETAQFLCSVLADEFVLYVKTLNAHWNVEGKDFYNKHLFFETQYKALTEIIDDVAERIRSLGHYAPAKLSAFLELTHLTEQSRQKNDSIGFMDFLLEDHDSIIFLLRGSINELADGLKDSGSSDFITGLLEKHEKMAWMLRSHLF